MKFTPKVHQQMMRDFILEHPISNIWGGMGVGKTASVLSAVSVLLRDGATRGVLIIAPKRVVTLTWPNEQADWQEEFGWMKMVSLRTPEGWAAWDAGAADIYLLNYDLIQQFVKRALPGKKGLPVDMVVYDEISRFKDPASLRAKALRPHRGLFSRHVGLTGTPAPNNYLDLFGQIRMLDGGVRLGQHVTSYKQRFFASDYMGFSWTIYDWAAKVIEEKIADITLTVRTEDWVDLPPVTYSDMEVALPVPARKKYRELEKDLLIQIADKEIVALNAAVLVGKLQQITSGAVYDDNRAVVPVHEEKIKALQKIIKSAVGPVLVATSFIHERERILKAIPQAEMFDEASLGRWNKRQIPVWVADYRSISHGLNLQSGSQTLVWFSIPYSREGYDQMCARLVRMGQDKPVTIWHLLATDTIDEAVFEVLRRKGDQQSGLLLALKNLKLLREATP